jgi:hypothetical protein
MSGIIQTYSSFELSRAAMSKGFMELSNLEGYLGKSVIVPAEDECRGDRERRSNGEEVCRMNITVQLLLDLAR